MDYQDWINDVEAAIGRKLTHDNSKLRLGEIGTAAHLWPAGLTVEGMVALINDDGREMCIGGSCGSIAPKDVHIIDPRM